METCYDALIGKIVSVKRLDWSSMFGVLKSADLGGILLEPAVSPEIGRENLVIEFLKGVITKEELLEKTKCQVFDSYVRERHSIDQVILLS